MNSVIIYYIIINIISLIKMGWDKYCAINNKWRISEYELLMISLIGGSLGTLIGMQFFKHKTRKLYFKLLIPIFLIINILTIILFF